MKNSDENVLNHPEVVKYLKDVFPIIITESDRGAILIAASQVDLFLEKSLQEVAPKKISQNKLNNLFDFTGPLGTFSSRIRMANFMRIINDDVLSGINSLRDLRNEAAHHPTSFSLSSRSDKINNLYKLGPGVQAGLQVWAIKSVLESFIQHGLSLKDDNENFFSDSSDIIEFISKDHDAQNAILSNVPKWQLGLSIALLCALLFHRSNVIKNIFDMTIPSPNNNNDQESPAANHDEQ